LDIDGKSILSNVFLIPRVSWFFAMATIDLATAKLLSSKKTVQLSQHSAVKDPWVDYDDDGNPVDYGFDEEGGDMDPELASDLDDRVFDVNPSEFAETAIRIPEAGKISDFTFKGREYLRKIYDTQSKRVLLKCGRQVEKSTTVGNRIICYSALTNNFRSLYVAPSAEQAKVFSNDRLKDVMDASPMLKAYTPPGMNQAVFFKKLINYSQIRLRYAYLTADRVRGIPADQILIDEIQDILVDNIPVIEQCAFHSTYKLFMYSGTPKSMDNTIEVYWNDFSTQNEWVVPCEHHGTPKDKSSWHWNVLGVKNIGKQSLICDKCGNQIHAAHPDAKWAALNPVRANNEDKVTFDGYRIPQIMVPWVDWQEVVEALEQYPRAKFMNEKLGMSYDSGVRPISKAQLVKCSKPDIRLMDIEAFKEVARGRQIYAGIDWGSGESASYTVMTLGGYLGTGNLSVFWIHRFTGQDLEPERQIDLISQIISQLDVRLVGTDYGGGFYPNDQLVRRFGPRKIHKYQYNPRQKRKVYWEPALARWMAHRTEVMTAVFTMMKKQKLDLPHWDDIADPFGSDIMNIFTEYNDRLRMNEYKKPPGKTDDAFHSILLMVLVSMLEVPRPDIITPDKETGVPQMYGG